jgi:hypothetical protein
MQQRGRQGVLDTGEATSMSTMLTPGRSAASRPGRRGTLSARCHRTRRPRRGPRGNVSEPTPRTAYRPRPSDAPDGPSSQRCQWLISPSKGRLPPAPHAMPPARRIHDRRTRPIRELRRSRVSAVFPGPCSNLDPLTTTQLCRALPVRFARAQGISAKEDVHKSVHKRHENGPRRHLRGPFYLVAGTGFEPATSGL